MTRERSYLFKDEVDQFLDFPPRHFLSMLDSFNDIGTASPEVCGQLILWIAVSQEGLKLWRRRGCTTSARPFSSRLVREDFSIVTGHGRGEPERGTEGLRGTWRWADIGYMDEVGVICTHAEQPMIPSRWAVELREH